MIVENSTQLECKSSNNIVKESENNSERESKKY